MTLATAVVCVSVERWSTCQPGSCFLAGVCASALCGAHIASAPGCNSCLSYDWGCDGCRLDPAGRQFERGGFSAQMICWLPCVFSRLEPGLNRLTTRLIGSQRVYLKPPIVLWLCSCHGTGNFSMSACCTPQNSRASFFRPFKASQARSLPPNRQLSYLRVSSRRSTLQTPRASSSTAVVLETSASASATQQQRSMAGVCLLVEWICVSALHPYHTPLTCTEMLGHTKNPKRSTRADTSLTHHASQHPHRPLCRPGVQAAV